MTIGVAASLFTALVVTRLIFNFLLDRNWLKSLPMLHIIRSTKVNFMKAARPLFVITWAFVILSLGYGIFGRGDKLFGVDFLGGDSTTFSFPAEVDVEHIRDALTRIGEKDAQIQYQKDVSGGGETLRVTTSSGSEQKVEQALAKQFPQAQFVVKTRQQVGAIVGAQIRQSAVIACLLSMFGILLYVAFRYEFSFAVGAIVGVLHDVLLAIGCYCIANAVSGRQFNATVVAALLTIIGFSLNDKVVIFDRIRENLKLGVRGTFSEVINQALNQTLSRTIITSGTVLIATTLFVHLGRRRHQRLCLHLSHRHHHRHLFEHLHRQRLRALVAQGRTPHHWRVAGDNPGHDDSQGGFAGKGVGVDDLRLLPNRSVEGRNAGLRPGVSESQCLSAGSETDAPALKSRFAGDESICSRRVNRKS